MNKLQLSSLGHTWIFDIDGTIVKHNGYMTEEGDVFLPGAKEFLTSIPDSDMIIFITAREEKQRDITEKFLKSNNIRYDHIIFDAPTGERILINDDKPSGLQTAFAIKLKRDQNFCSNQSGCHAEYLSGQTGQIITADQMRIDL